MALPSHLREKLIKVLFDYHLESVQDSLVEIVLDGCPGLNNMDDEDLLSDYSYCVGEEDDLYQRCCAELEVQKMVEER